MTTKDEYLEFFSSKSCPDVMRALLVEYNLVRTEFKSLVDLIDKVPTEEGKAKITENLISSIRARSERMDAVSEAIIEYLHGLKPSDT